MTKAATAKRQPGASGIARGRTKYAQQACSVCRSKKTRCDGQKPVCQPCLNSGRGEECNWEGESVRKPRTEAHFEAMRKQVNAYKAYVVHLEAELEKYRREYANSPGRAFGVGGEPVVSFPYHHLRPQSVDFDGETDNDDDFYEELEETDPPSPGDPVDQICGATQTLKLSDREGCLVGYGNTAIFRFAPEILPVSRVPPVMEDPEQSYVLQLDGVNESHISPALNWSRYLPLEVQSILTRPEHDKLLDILFKFVTCWCLRIIPSLFLRDMWKVLSAPAHLGPPKAPHYSPMLHNALLAVAAAFSEDPRIRDVRTRRIFADEARKYLEAEQRQPSITLIHSLSILSTYHSSLGEQTEGYICFGNSARISQALGLNIDCSGWVDSGWIGEQERLDRNWAHWTTLCQDVCWSLYVGRDFSVQVPRNIRGIPVPFVDSEFDNQPWEYKPSNIPAQPGHLSKTFAASCQLLTIARQVMEVVNGLGTHTSRQEMLISSIDLELNEWKRTLAPEVDLNHKTRPTATPHCLTMHMVYWWLFILLHRPFYRRQKPLRGCDVKIDHVKLCKRAAENIMELLHHYRNLYTLRYCPISLVQIVFATGTVKVLNAVHATSGLRVAKETLQQSQEQANLCIEYLEEIGRSWHCAINTAEIFRKLLSQILTRPEPDRALGSKTQREVGVEVEESLLKRRRNRSLSHEASFSGPLTFQKRPVKQRRNQIDRIASDSSAPGASGLTRTAPQVGQVYQQSSPATTCDSEPSPAPSQSGGSPNDPAAHLPDPTSRSSTSPEGHLSTSAPADLGRSQQLIEDLLRAINDPFNGMMPSWLPAMKCGQALPEEPFMHPIQTSASTQPLPSSSTPFTASIDGVYNMNTNPYSSQQSSFSDFVTHSGASTNGSSTLPSTAATSPIPMSARPAVVDLDAIDDGFIFSPYDVSTGAQTQPMFFYSHLQNLCPSMHDDLIHASGQQQQQQQHPLPNSFFGQQFFGMQGGATS